MASVKVKFRPSTVSDHEGTIYYQIIHERKQRQLFSNYHIFPNDWDERRSKVKVPRLGDRITFLLSIRERIRWDVERLTKIIRSLEDAGFDYTVGDVVDEFNRYTKEYSVFNFMESMIVELRQNGKIRTSETYRAALNSFKKFRDGEDIMLDCLNSKLMVAYEAWQKSRGISANTISFYMRILRAAYHRAVEEEITENRYPFRHVYTGIDKTVKRALPLVTIKKIKALDLSLFPELDYARDMFMLSFMLRGMSFIDMVYLRKVDLTDGHITYRRRKTGQQLTIKWTKEMQRVVDKYPENDSEYLLPIVQSAKANERNVYRNIGYNINQNLKKVAEKAGITISLTLYVARHSWASIAKAQGVPLSVISEGMGHDSETTTQIYLASLESSTVDEANSMILKSLD